MDFGSINWLAVVACVVVSMISGSIWYNPKTFFPIWWKGIGKGDAQPGMGDNMAMTWGLTILSSLVQVIFHGLVCQRNGQHERRGHLGLWDDGWLYALAGLCGHDEFVQQTLCWLPVLRLGH